MSIDKESRHADIAGIVILDELFSAQGVDDGCLQPCRNGE
jgi:hypothetical protein